MNDTTTITSDMDGTIRQRSILSGRERWEVDSLLKNPRLGNTIESQLSCNSHIFKVLANPSSGRVLVIFTPYQFEPGEIGRLILAIVSNSKESDDDDEAIATTPFRSRAQAMAQRAQSNELYQLIKHAEVDSSQRKKAIRLSVVHAGFKLLSPFSISLMVSSVLFPFATLTKMGLGKGLQLVIFGSLFGAARLGESVASHKKTVAWSEYANEIDNTLVKQTFEHVQSLDMAYLEGQNTEQLMNAINSDTDVVKRFLIFAPQEMTEKLTTIAIASAGILILSPGAFLLCVLPIPLITRFSKRQKEVTKDKYQKSATLEGQYSQVLASNLNGLSTVKSFTAEDQEIERLSQAKNRASKIAVEIDRDNSYYNNVGEFTLVIGMITPLIHGCANVLKGGISLPQFLMQNSLVPPLLLASTGMEYSRGLYKQAKMAAGRLTTLLNQRPEMSDESNAVSLQDVHGQLNFNDISFGYTDVPVLNGVSFEINKHGKIAFVGPTGSGKSTLMKLLLRFYQLDQGSITLDGIDIHDIKLKELRQTIALVSQDPYLFNGTIYQNLLYGCPDASHEQVVQACKVAQAYEFIMDHPDGLHAQIGERGNKLSGGQRQRLSIARAVLKNASILILDEATSAVDNETEAAIKKSVELISKNSTVIIIAHRLSTIRYVDTIYHLKAGQISEQGSHEQLLALNGDYASLWQLQTAGKEIEKLPAVPATLSIVKNTTETLNEPLESEVV